MFNRIKTDFSTEDTEKTENRFPLSGLLKKSRLLRRYAPPNELRNRIRHDVICKCCNRMMLA